MGPFILILVSTVVITVGTFFPGAGPVPPFATAWWFRILGGAILLGNVAALVMALVQRKWTSLVCHLGVALLAIGVVRDMKSMTILAELEEGETITTYSMMGAEKPLGFSLKLISFQEKGYVSRVQFDGREERTIAPSHPTSYQGWLLLQDSYDRVSDTNRFTLLAGNGETLRVKTGDRFRVPGSELSLQLDPDFALGQDTMFRFRTFEQGRERTSGFMSRRAVVPPTLKTGVKLLDYRLGGRFVSTLLMVKRPGAGVAFVSFAVIILGLLMMAINGLRAGRARRTD